MEILEYDPKFLIEQVKFVNKIQSSWIPSEFKQTVKNYKQVFIEPQFGPSLNLYAFKNNQMLGVLNSFLSLNNEILTIEILTDDLETSRVLYQNLLQKLDGKRINQIRILASEKRGNTLNIAQHLQFIKGPVRSIFAIIDPAELKVQASDFKLSDYDEEKDMQQVLDIYVNELGFDANEMENELKEMYKLKPLILNWKIVRAQTQIVAFNLLLTDKPGDKDAYMQSIYVRTGFDKIGICNSILQSHKAICNTLHIESVTLTLRGNENNEIEFYKKFGFEGTEIYYYTKYL